MKKILYLILLTLNLQHLTPTQQIPTPNTLILGLTLFLSQQARQKKLNKITTLKLILQHQLKKQHIKLFPTDLKKIIYQSLFGWTPHGLHTETATKLDPHNFNQWGTHKRTISLYNPDGFDQYGIHKTTKTRFDPQGYNIDKWNRYGANKITGTLYSPHGLTQDTTYASISLLKACKSQHPSLKNIKFLLKNRHTDINLRDKDGLSLLAYCCEKQHQSIIKLLLQQLHLNTNIKDKEGETLLIYCSLLGDSHLKLAQALLAHRNTDPNLKNNYGETPLIICSSYNALGIAKAILAHPSTDPNLKDSNDRTPLIYCIEKGDQTLNIVKALLAHKHINPNLRTKGTPPLIWCCYKGDLSLDIVKALLAHKNININLQDNNGYTPLDIILYHSKKTENYIGIKSWILIITHGGKLSRCKKMYKHLKPNSFNQPQKSYLHAIKNNPPINQKHTNQPF